MTNRIYDRMIKRLFTLTACTKKETSDFEETLDCVGVQLPMYLRYHNRFESIHMTTNSNRFNLDSHLNTLGSLDSVLNLNRFVLLFY